MVRYRNTKTGQIIEREDAQAVFDRSSRWERLPDDVDLEAAAAPVDDPGPAGGPPVVDDPSPDDGQGDGDGDGADGGSDDDSEGDSVDLTKLSRADLDAHAAKVGVQEPEKLQNKGAVIEAIQAKA